MQADCHALFPWVSDWLHAEDNCRATDLILRKGTPGDIYKVGGDNELSNIDVGHLLLHALAQQTGIPPEDRAKVITFVLDRLGHGRRSVPNATEERTMLDWVARTEFDLGVSGCVEWTPKYRLCMCAERVPILRRRY